MHEVVLFVELLEIVVRGLLRGEVLPHKEITHAVNVVFDAMKHELVICTRALLHVRQVLLAKTVDVYVAIVHKSVVDCDSVRFSLHHDQLLQLRYLFSKIVLWWWSTSIGIITRLHMPRQS